jgi:hypothetical protein
VALNFSHLYFGVPNNRLTFSTILRIFPGESIAVASVSALLQDVNRTSLPFKHTKQAAAEIQRQARPVIAQPTHFAYSAGLKNIFFVFCGIYKIYTHFLKFQLKH